MAPEIADSDAESDTKSPNRPAYSPLNDEEVDMRHLDPAAPDPVLDLPFSQFLSPTQRLSSYVNDQQNTQPLPSSATTDSVLRELGRAQEGLRESTSIAFDASSDNYLDTANSMRQKRRFSDIENQLSSQGVVDDGRRQGTKKPKTYGASRSQRSDTSSVMFPGVDHPSHRLGGHIGGGIAEADPSSSRLKRAMNSIERIYESKSTSGYQGFNMDFRNGSLNLDADVNPFLDATQSSVGSQGPLMELGVHAGLPGGHTMQLATSLSENVQSSRAFNDWSGHAAKSQKESPQAASNNSASPERVHNESVVADAGEDVSQSTMAKNTSKKRGRKAKSETGASKSSTVVPVDGIDELGREDVHEETKAKKRKRGRPSRVEGERNSPSKNLSSELQLSDDFYTLYPKDNYQPRPSRSRGKPAIEAEAQDRAETDEASQDGLQQRSRPEPIEETFTTAAEAVKKRGRKAKNKATTISDSTPEQAQVIPDEVSESTEQNVPKPALTDTNASQEDGHAKRGMEDSKEDSANYVEADEDVEVAKHTRPVKKISVNIPSPAESKKSKQTTKSEPKKRGRKPKKKVGVRDDEIDDAATAEVKEQDSERERTALADKDPNVQSSSDPKNTLDVKSVLDDQNGEPVEVGVDEEVLENQSPPDSKNETTSLPQPDIDMEVKQETLELDPKSTAVITTASKTSSSPSLSSTKSTFSTIQKTRVGLSRRLKIPSLLRKLDRTKDPPKIVERKEKLTKKQKEAEEKRRLEAEDGEEPEGRWNERGKDGMLIEWND